MDIENMHPFCLPFGFCHDATSSSIAADFNPLHNNNNSSNNNNNNNNNISINNSNNHNDSATSSSNDNNHQNKDKLRSKTSSPSDDLFKHFHGTSTSGNSLLNDDDLIIGSSSALDIGAPDESFYSLELDIDIDEDGDNDNHVARFSSSSAALGLDENDDDDNNDDAVDELKSGEDWFCSHYSLFSPSPTGAHPTRRKPLVRSALLTGGLNSNQVFQHVVDPIDIKSSPTLAQLNLNSTDDPTDGFWDTAPTASATSTNRDLLQSNSTSINGPTGALTCTGHNTSTCNHLHHHSIPNHHHHHHHHHHHLPPYSSHLNSESSSPACHHVHQHHQSRFNSSSNSISSTQSTCLAVTPFRRPDVQAYSTCCHNLLSTSNASANLPSGTDNNTSINNLKPSATLNQLNQQQALSNSNNNNSTTSQQPLRRLTGLDKQATVVAQKIGQQQRSASPALVTSSSSPLSSSFSAPSTGPLSCAPVSTAPTLQQAASATGDNRLIDNKLKENIEYLTALLCNGNNKLDNGNQQQATISSSMARSYTTLAHSLSTGPKLLERHQPSLAMSSSNHHHQKTLTPHQQTNGCNPTNEAAPCIEQQPIQQNLQQQTPNALKRPYSDQWFKLPVESSVSAADSTDQSQTSASLSNDSAHSCPAKLSACSQQQQQQQHHHLHHQQPATTQVALGGQLSLEQRQKSSDLKVLSSLLSSNKCIPSTCAPAPITVQGWQSQACQNQNNTQTLHSESIQLSNSVQDQSSIADKPDPISIPAKGKPITLTPIATSAVIVPQPKIRSNLFAQPASPSASSTASSGNNTDIGSTSTGNSIKRQRGSQPPSANQKGSNRSARPNSLSNDCSLSSHDEGFSSQIDNDDCGSNNSDDEDDVDSDDESFYGDYTNSDLIGASISDNVENKWTLNMGRTRKNGQKRYFWQYNVQSKGPKGTRICSTDDSEDPFVLPEASDPVFSNDCQVEGVKHSGKARRGDGNDLTPNPRKLLMIGLELKKLGKIINDLAPVTDLPMNARNKTRKEKNKLASRACRLKKKAQHEANKIKLYGLQREHQQVVLAIYDIRKLLSATLHQREAKQQQQQQHQIEQTQELATNDNGNTNSSVKTIAEQCSMNVAGQTSDYVNSVLEKVVSGCIDGGLQTN